ncbi:MAG TPA: permease [Pseudonocardiaceae bacterium]
MANPSDVEARLSALEARMEEVAADAAAARHLVAARDRDLADLGVKVDANRSAINALGVQTAARFDRLEGEMRTGFAEMRGKLDQSAAGQQQIVELLTGLIAGQDDQ